LHSDESTYSEKILKLIFIKTKRRHMNLQYHQIRSLGTDSFNNPNIFPLKGFHERATQNVVYYIKVANKNALKMLQLVSFKYIYFNRFLSLINCFLSGCGVSSYSAKSKTSVQRPICLTRLNKVYRHSAFTVYVCLDHTDLFQAVFDDITFAFFYHLKKTK